MARSSVFDRRDRDRIERLHRRGADLRPRVHDRRGLGFLLRRGGLAFRLLLLFLGRARDGFRLSRLRERGR